MNMKLTLFWNVTPYILVEIYWRFGGTRSTALDTEGGIFLQETYTWLHNVTSCVVSRYVEVFPYVFLD
jgi:nitrate reductase gamma subunit